MAEEIFASVQVRRDNKANWEAANPVLLDGEAAYEKDTDMFKIGDGVNNYKNLLYHNKVGPKGDTGADGKTAYAYAQEGGYTGTEVEFAAKLAQDMPTALPNPQPITINGQRYDGSEAVTVTVSSEGGGTPVEIDDTLTQSGKAADAKAVGDQLSALNEANATQDERITTLEQTIPSGSSGLTVAQVNALNGMFKVAAYIKSDVSAEYSAFKTAFGIEDSGEEPVEPEKTLTSISATYSGGDVAVGTSLDNLTGIVVTATYSDGSTATVTGYTLSGSIAEGANTIMVSYGSKTATFTVTGIVEVVDEKWSYTLSDLTVMKGSIGNNIAGEITANIGTAQAIRRRHYAIETEGVKQIIYTEVATNLESDINNYTRKGLYPIPIPKTAIKVTYSIEPATQYPAICIYEYDANTDTYTRTADPGWKLGGGTYTLTPKDNQYLTMASKYDATGNQYPTEPTAVSIVFE